MKGVQYFFDEYGEPKVVLIDVKKNPELWEDFRDYLTLRERQNEVPIPFESRRICERGIKSREALPVDIAPSAKKDLGRLPRKMADRIVAAVDALAENPRPHGAIKLEGVENQYRIRVGEYRVKESINDNALTMLIIRVRNRKDACR